MVSLLASISRHNQCFQKCMEMDFHNLILDILIKKIDCTPIESECFRALLEFAKKSSKIAEELVSNESLLEIMAGAIQSEDTDLKIQVFSFIEALCLQNDKVARKIVEYPGIVSKICKISLGSNSNINSNTITTTLIPSLNSGTPANEEKSPDADAMANETAARNRPIPSSKPTKPNNPNNSTPVKAPLPKSTSNSTSNSSTNAKTSPSTVKPKNSATAQIPPTNNNTSLFMASYAAKNAANPNATLSKSASPVPHRAIEMSPLLKKCLYMAISGLAYQKSEFAKKIIEEGIFPSIFTIFKQKPYNSVHYAAMKLIASVSRHGGEFANFVWQFEIGIKRVIEYLKSVPKINHAFPAILTIGYLSSLSQKHALKIVQYGALDAVVDILKSPNNPAHIISKACWCLTLIGEQSQKTAEKVGEHGGFQALVNLINNTFSPNASLNFFQLNNSFSGVSMGNSQTLTNHDSLLVSNDGPSAHDLYYEPLTSARKQKYNLEDIRKEAISALEIVVVKSLDSSAIFPCIEETTSEPALYILLKKCSSLLENNGEEQRKLLSSKTLAKIQRLSHSGRLGEHVLSAIREVNKHFASEVIEFLQPDFEKQLLQTIV